jgi:hypothetical protein
MSAFKKISDSFGVNEVIDYRKDEKRFTISERGLHILDTYAKMDELLIRKTMYKMKKTPDYATPFL